MGNTIFAATIKADQTDIVVAFDGQTHEVIKMVPLRNILAKLVDYLKNRPGTLADNPVKITPAGVLTNQLALLAIRDFLIKEDVFVDYSGPVLRP